MADVEKKDGLDEGGARSAGAGGAEAICRAKGALLASACYAAAAEP